jgi:hypothetical protein
VGGRPHKVQQEQEQEEGAELWSKGIATTALPPLATRRIILYRRVRGVMRGLGEQSHPPKPVQGQRGRGFITGSQPGLVSLPDSRQDNMCWAVHASHCSFYGLVQTNSMLCDKTWALSLTLPRFAVLTLVLTIVLTLPGTCASGFHFSLAYNCDASEICCLIDEPQLPRKPFVQTGVGTLDIYIALTELRPTCNL